MRRHTLSSLLAVGLLVGMTVAAADAPEVAEHTDNIEHVANFAHKNADGEDVASGSDIEFVDLDVEVEVPRTNPNGKRIPGTETETQTRTFSLAGTTGNGLQIYDVTDPENTTRASHYDCDANQGDIQIFERGERTFITYTTEDTSPVSEESDCHKLIGDEQANSGTFIIDITDPYNPVGEAFIEVPEGSHNGTVDPTGTFFYNSNSDLTGFDAIDGDDPSPSIEIYDISDLDDIERTGVLELPVRPGLGTDSHDITFNDDGSRAYSAALSQTVIINTEDLAEPKIVSSFVDPAINVEHQSDPFTINEGEDDQRDFLIIEDEFIGALPSGQCPNGGVHVYEITGAMEENPVKIGYWNVAEFRPATNDETGGLIGESDISRCTAHVFDIHPEEEIMTIAFYNAGVRIVDISGLEGVGLGDDGVGNPMRQIAFYQYSDSDTWAAKTPRIEEDGSFYLYGNDLARGLDIFHYDGNDSGATDQDGQAVSAGTWMTPAEAEANLNTVSAEELASAGVNSDLRPYCLIPSS